MISSKNVLRISLVLIVVLALMAGYYEAYLSALLQKNDRTERDFRRLQRYIGTDKSLEILRKEKE
jgi:hypothetical protein